tara:strand:+ start:9890 stop:10783 length:894 start_codon:yes stop_codon:yes gene_type:complete
MKLKTLQLQNYAGYRDATFNFANEDGSIRPIGIFFGPNGCGKSTGLHAMRLLGNLGHIKNRENDLLFRKMIFHPDYDPSLPHFANHQNVMSINAVFTDGNQDYVAEIRSDHAPDGIVKCEIPNRNVCVFVDADHTINRQKFQLPADGAELFLDMARIVYGYEVSLGRSVSTYESAGRENQGQGMQVDFYQDVIIDKGDAKVHFKSMSDGEKKIATLLRQLCDPTIIHEADIVLVDNIEMHVYFERHARMIDKLLASFPGKQFLVTSHSGVMINHVGETYGTGCLFNVPEIKGQRFAY